LLRKVGIDLLRLKRFHTQRENNFKDSPISTPFLDVAAGKNPIVTTFECCIRVVACDEAFNVLRIK